MGLNLSKQSGGSAWTTATGNDYSSNDDWTNAFYDYVNSLGGKSSLSDAANAKYNFLSAMSANEYSTSERLAAQQWQEDFYNAYSSPSAMVRQYEEAGLNPALMYDSGNGTGSTESSSGASATSAASVSSNTFGVLNYVDALTKGLSSISSNIESLTRSRLNSKNLSWTDSLNEQSLKESSSRISLNSASEDLSRVNSGLVNANRVLTEYKTRSEQSQNEFILQNIENLKSQNSKTNKEVEGIGIDNLQKALNYTLDSIYRASERDKDLSLKDIQKLLYGKQVDSVSADNWYKDWQNGFIQKVGFDPTANVQTMCGQLIGSVAIEGEQLLDEAITDVVSGALKNSVKNAGSSFWKFFKNLFTRSD